MASAPPDPEASEPIAPPLPPGDTYMDFKDSSHGAYLHDGVCTLWQTKQHADIILKIGDLEVPCHIIILSISSPHLRRLLSSADSVVPGDGLDGRPTLEVVDVPSELLTDILKYIYTGEIKVFMRTVRELLQAARLWNISGLATLCTVFLERSITIDHVLNVLETADLMELVEVEEKCVAFIVDHFRRFTEQWNIHQKFNKISAKHLCMILESDKLDVNTEDDTCMAVLEWFKFDPDQRLGDIYDVFRHVRLTYVDLGTLGHLQMEPLLLPEQRCQQLFQLVESTPDSGYSPDELVSCFPRKAYNYVTCLVLPDKIPSVRLVRFGGRVSGGILDRVADVPWAANGCIKVCCRSGSGIYVSGIGQKATEVWKFDTNTISWTQCPSLIAGRRQHGFVVANKHLYAVAGSNLQTVPYSVLSSVECLSLVFSEVWRKTSRGLIHRVRRCACVVKGKRIYIFGGQDAMNKSCNYVQIFDTETEVCKANLTTMPVPIVDGQAVGWRNLIFLLGKGVFFIYNDEYNTWITTNLGVNMSHFGCVFNAPNLYIFGGFTYEGERTTCSDRVYSIKVKNILNNKRLWKDAGQIDCPMCVYSATDVGLLREYVPAPALSVIMPPAVTTQQSQEVFVEENFEDDDADALPSYDEVMQMMAAENTSSSSSTAAAAVGVTTTLTTADGQQAAWTERTAGQQPMFYLSQSPTPAQQHGRQSPALPQFVENSQYLGENSANESAEAWQQTGPRTASPRPSAPPAYVPGSSSASDEVTDRFSSLSVSPVPDQHQRYDTPPTGEEREVGRTARARRRDSDLEAVWL